MQGFDMGARWGAAGCAVLALVLTGCGSVPTPATGAAQQTPAPVASTTLRGNWLLRGSLPGATLLPAKASTGMAVTFDVAQGVLMGSARIVTTCGGVPTGITLGGELAGSLQGQVLSDGSFSASTGGGFGPVLRITGVAPAARGGTWSGAYTLTGGLGCTLNETGSIQATPIGEVSGTYTGQAVVTTAGPNLNAPTAPAFPNQPLLIHAILQQGAIFHAPGRMADGTETEIALGGSLQVAGLPCFNKGQISTTAPSEVKGNEVEATFVMDDASTAILDGYVDEPTAGSLVLEQLRVNGGGCGGIYLFQSDTVLRR